MSLSVKSFWQVSNSISDDFGTFSRKSLGQNPRVRLSLFFRLIIVSRSTWTTLIFLYSQIEHQISLFIFHTHQEYCKCYSTYMSPSFVLCKWAECGYDFYESYLCIIYVISSMMIIISVRYCTSGLHYGVWNELLLFRLFCEEEKRHKRRVAGEGSWFFAHCQSAQQPHNFVRCASVTRERPIPRPSRWAPWTIRLWNEKAFTSRTRTTALPRVRK